MKYVVALTLILLIASASAADSPPELAAARSRYETALAASAKPIRDRYLQELQQLKDRAMAMKSLDLAVAVDQEIKVISGAPNPTAPLPAGATGSGIAQSPSAAHKNNAFRNGSLSDLDQDGKPTGWTLGSFSKLVAEGQRHYVHCVVPGDATGLQVVCSQDVAVPPTAKLMTVSLRSRAKEKETKEDPSKKGFEAKIDLTDLNGKVQRTYMQFPNRHTNWTQTEQKMAIPAGVAKFNFALRVLELKGEFDFEDFVLEFK